MHHIYILVILCFNSILLVYHLDITHYLLAYILTTSMKYVVLCNICYTISR